MKAKLWYLIKVSLGRKIKTKWFVVANVLLLILIEGLINIDSVIKMFGGDFNEKQVVYVVDNSNKSYDILKSQNENYSSLFNSDDDSSFEIKKTTEDPKKLLAKKDNKDAWVLVFDNNAENVLQVKLISDGFINTTDYAQISTLVNNTKSTVALSETNIDPSELAKISAPVKIEREVLDEKKKSEDENMQMISLIFLLLFVTGVLGYITSPVITIVLNGMQKVVATIFSIFI